MDVILQSQSLKVSGENNSSITITGSGRSHLFIRKREGVKSTVLKVHQYPNITLQGNLGDVPNTEPTVVTLNGNLYQLIEHNRNHSIVAACKDENGNNFSVPYREIDSNTIELHSNLPLIGTITIY